jgi:hypothetical protein
VFAGAAREAVFSRPEVIKRVKADFIPVALKAALVNRPPGDEEGLLYREIGRSKPAPQGICVVNSSGKVLEWTLMFDDDKSVLDFFDHAKKRFARFPDAKKPVTAEVFEKFPSRKRQDIKDSGVTLPVPDRHAVGKLCPAKPRLPRGTVAMQLFGRALGKDGKPVADAVRQENYIEDRFHIGVGVQETLAGVLSEGGNDPVKLPRAVTRQWVKQAYLGMLDVQPLDNPAGARGELKKCDFRATRVRNGKGPTLWRVDGESEVFIDNMANAGPGDLHEIKLRWRGFIEMTGDRMTRLLLSAGGKEKLKFNSARDAEDNEVSSLPAGHRIDRSCGVRFGMIGEPVGPGQVAEAPDGPNPEAPEEAVRQITQMLGPSFLVFRDKVQKELKLSKEQARKVRKVLPSTIQDAMQFFGKLEKLDPEERDKEVASYRRKAHEKLATFLKGTLNGGQLARLRQLELQQEGLFALGQPDVAGELKLTDEQRKQFMAAVGEMQKKIAPLIEKIQSGKGKPEEIAPKIMKIRQGAEARIESILHAKQKKQWQKLLGKAFDLNE